MKIISVDALRDGGTIIMTVSDYVRPGDYMLPTPFTSEPRHLFWNNTQLEIGSPEELEFLAKLRLWLEEHAADKLVDSLHNLDKMKEKPSPIQREKAFTWHRVLYVADYLEHRPTTNKPHH
jgi:hypothetical protein